MTNASNPLDMAWYQRFSGVAKATRAVAEHRGKLDPDGCLVRFISQPTRRENGCGYGLQEGRWRALLNTFNAIGLRRFCFALDNGRLMGVRFPAFNFELPWTGSNRP